jgi:serine/threonine protein kinase
MFARVFVGVETIVGNTQIEPGGRTIGRYGVIAEIGRGGMSTVHRALDPVLKRDVALKLLAPALSTDSEAIARFQREATAVATLKHQAIAMVYEFGEESSQYFIAFEWIDGSDLRNHIKKHGRLDIAAARRLFNQVADALSYAHERGVIHRDIKPANIIISGAGNATLVDFGLAWMADLPSLTSTGVVYGTPLYMAPEQVEGRAVDQRTDVYSLAFVLYEILTGKTPFDESSTPALLIQQLNRVPPPMSEINPQLPVGLDEVFAKATAKQATARYESIDAFRNAVNAVLPDKDGTVTIRMSPMQRTRAQRRPTLFSALMIGVGVLSVIASLGVAFRNTSTTAALQATATAQSLALAQAVSVAATANVAPTVPPNPTPQPSATPLPPPPYGEIREDSSWLNDAANPQRNRAVNEFQPFGNREALWKQSVDGDDLGDALGVIVARKQLITSHKNGRIQAFSITDGEATWSQTAPQKLSASPVLCCAWSDDPILIAPLEGGEVIGYSVRDANERWRLPNDKTGAQLPDAIAGMTVGYDSVIYAATYNGWVVALSPFDGSIRWQLEFKGQKFWDAPVVSNAGVYVVNRESGVMYAIDRTKQTQIWERKIEAGLAHNALVSGDSSYLVVPSPKQLTALSPLTGEVLWTAPTQHDIAGIAGDWGGIYLTSYTGHVYAFNVQDGVLRWQTRWERGINAPPLTDGRRLLIADSDGGLRVFSTETGQEQADWRIDSDGVESFGPVFVDGWLLTLSKNAVQVFAPGRP